MISYMNSKRNSCYNSVSNKGVVNIQTREIDLLGTDSTVIRKQQAPAQSSVPGLTDAELQIKLLTLEQNYKIRKNKM